MAHAAATADHDVIIVGAGIVGASIAFHLAPFARVLVLEGEPQPGYHATGRSAALFTEAYGPPMIRALTRASRAFFDSPPENFAPVPLLRPRGTLFVGNESQRQEVAALHERLLREGIETRVLTGEEARELVPVLRPEACACALLDADAFDVDVDALLQGYLRGARACGASILTNAALASASRSAAGWAVKTRNGDTHAAPLLVNAAGAWLDEVATVAGAAPAHIDPRRRSAFLFEVPQGVSIAQWPAVIAIDESWYFKPDAGLLLGSPANADSTTPHDVVPEELDIATGIYRIEQATTLTIRRPKSTWAGLRSFAGDGEPVCGFDGEVPGFFWAGAVGGYGIQTSPAFGQMCASLIRGKGVPGSILAQGMKEDLVRKRRPQPG